MMSEAIKEERELQVLEDLPLCSLAKATPPMPISVGVKPPASPLTDGGPLPLIVWVEATLRKRQGRCSYELEGRLDSEGHRDACC